MYCGTTVSGLLYMDLIVGEFCTVFLRPFPYKLAYNGEVGRIFPQVASCVIWNAARGSCFQFYDDDIFILSLGITRLSWLYLFNKTER